MGMPGWPDYWYGFPPMLYATHAIAPLAELAGTDIKSVICHGSGTIAQKYQKKYDSRFSVETAHLEFRDSDLTAEVTRSLFDLIRQYRESFDVFGTKMSFEWEQVSGEGPVIFTGLEDAERIEVPDYDHLLPEEIRAFTEGAAHDKDHASFIQGGGHGGSHPHMAHEFITAIAENREPLIDALKAANWTVAGICAHESALKGGVRIELPEETF
jgi:predicted dehydrogenase